MKRFTFDFSIICDDDRNSEEFFFDVLFEDEATAQDTWRRLLEHLPAGMVGGGIYPTPQEDLIYEQEGQAG